MAALIIQSGKHQGREIKIPVRDGDLFIGRDEGCFIRLISTEVSRQHCALRIQDDVIYVRDLGSRNGTRVNDVVIDGEVALAAGDILHVGHTEFEVTGVRRMPLEPGLDDAIAEWLSDSDTHTGSPIEGDTAVIPISSSGTHPEIPDTVSAPAPVPAPEARPRKVQQTLEEEARAIIRKHLSLQEMRESVS
ncbi:MAG TPA: FHA domain-containing protein [Planctomycetaceae bacterium]|nr:FHA domain-containing protein [Planctomycetaceae bacterium]